MRNNLNTYSYLMSLIQPYFTYCNTTWASNYVTRLKTLIHLQKRIVRMMTNSSYREHTTPLFHSLKILKLNDIYIYQVALLIFKNSNNCLPPSISNNFKNRSEIHSHSTRSAYNIHIPLMRTSFAKRTILFQGPKIWNNLPRHITTISSIAIFKRTTCIKHYFLAYYQAKS